MFTSMEYLTDRALVIHAIWVDDEDMDLMAASGCSVAHNPLCNLKLGSGIMPFRDLTDRGINICLGSDEMCSDDAVNLWNVAKFAGLVHKIADSDYRKWPSARGNPSLRHRECGDGHAARRHHGDRSKWASRRI